MAKQELTAYEVPAEELLDRFMQTTAQAGVSNSGLCIDLAAGYDHSNMRYLRGVVLARIEGKKPPYAPGTKVTVKKNGAREVSFDGPALGTGSKYSINRVWYQKGQWALELKGVEGRATCPLYVASSFQVAEENEAATA